MSDIDALLRSAPPRPRRIVCMTEETTETLYRIGAGDLVVGVSGYTVRPPEARAKPKISAFLTANYERILALDPDLVLGFSDLQAEIARDLAKRGVPVFLFNQRSVAEILQTIRVLGGIVGREGEAEELAVSMEGNLRAAAAAAAGLPRRPRVFFEEWPDPLISGIRWVSELIEIAGGEDVCRESRASHDAKGRIFPPEEVAGRDPELILASWCGKKVSRETIAARPGWSRVAAVRADRIEEIPSEIILQPGPAALTDGLAALARHIAAAATGAAPTP